MYDHPASIARDRIIELAADPATRPYVVGYLLSCLDERHWAQLVQSALEFAEGQLERQASAQARAGVLLAERYR
jgi:hypothetical protein